MAFTLAVQAGVGGFVTAFLTGQANYLVAFVALALVGLGMAASTAHLGKMMRFYRGFNNLRHSNLSREALATVLFGAAAGVYMLADFAGFGLVAWNAGIAAVVAGAATIYFMVRCYRIPARPFWNHWQTGAAFAGTSLTLGGWLGLAFMPASPIPLLLVIAAGMAIESVGLLGHARAMRGAEHEGAVSHHVQRTTFGWVYRLRNALLGANLAFLVGLAVAGVSHPLPWLLGAAISVAAAVLGRAIFYVVVIPTTMPGAFFWKNKAFEQHARDIGLAANPAVGVAPVDH